jgi:hypothetical protein
MGPKNQPSGTIVRCHNFPCLSVWLTRMVAPQNTTYLNLGCFGAQGLPSNLGNTSMMRPFAPLRSLLLLATRILLNVLLGCCRRRDIASRWLAESSFLCSSADRNEELLSPRRPRLDNCPSYFALMIRRLRTSSRSLLYGIQLLGLMPWHHNRDMAVAHLHRLLTRPTEFTTIATQHPGTHILHLTPTISLFSPFHH